MPKKSSLTQIIKNLNKSSKTSGKCDHCQMKSIFSLDYSKAGKFMNRINQTFSQKQLTLEEKKENLVSSIKKAFADVQHELNTFIIDTKNQIILQIDKLDQESPINEYLFGNIEKSLKTGFGSGERNLFKKNYDAPPGPGRYDIRSQFDKPEPRMSRNLDGFVNEYKKRLRESNMYDALDNLENFDSDQKILPFSFWKDKKLYQISEEETEEKKKCWKIQEKIFDLEFTKQQETGNSGELISSETTRFYLEKNFLYWKSKL